MSSQDPRVRELYRIEQGDIDLSDHSYGLLIKNFTSPPHSLSLAKRLHAQISRRGRDHNTFLGNLVVDMYAKLGSLEEASSAFQRIQQRNVFSWNILLAAHSANGDLATAKKLFDKMPVRDTVSWSSMVGAFAQHELCDEAVSLFREMQLEGSKPDRITFINVIDACAEKPALQDGKFVYSVLAEDGLDSDVKVGTALLNMYGKCGSLRDAEALFEKMPERNAVSWNALLSAYAQNGHMESAREVFGSMPERNVVSWTGMMAGYVQNELCKDALELFLWMENDGVKPNENTFIALLDACASMSALSQGRVLHARVTAVGFDSKLKVGTCVLEMYGKCGRLEEARAVFDKMVNKSVITWNAMIGSYSRFGHWREALRVFLAMAQEGVTPTWITYISVLVACSHSGLLSQGKDYFTSMRRDFCIDPTIEHYHCMIDLVGRAGTLADAEELIHNMPFHSDSVTWAELVASSRIHGDLLKCERAAENTFEIDPRDPAHVILSNMYAAAGKPALVRKVRRDMKERGVKSRPGCSFIEIGNKVHEFVSGDSIHPLNEEIRAKTRELHERIKQELGYVPDTKEVLYDVDEEVKKKMLSFHSEKMAIAFGVLVTRAGTPLRVVKNLRVCMDCHTFTKLVSKCLGREIIMRDVNRFHSFKGGVCSCGDYW
ncbi:pentatricopeptide repeat-containing protein At3g62890-like [Selaginella moellendorffii]|uniref:pentatricopeptide repeat-containing protein At3g62890-like n=1 Tax=Selaginella moellendorffii TaxID=88036 RepID=UPI000D1C54CD|nr:pentatricopeptide repeat-containing protein At3g62890-like [Selaginella moellendorffii]|eukprot:XP_024537847.1 pentatricopeptide repeat-containing protein At3g62890-like [Selaginella moellendorffii]